MDRIRLFGWVLLSLGLILQSPAVAQSANQAAARSAAPPSAGGRNLLPAIEAASLVVVGVAAKPRILDRHGYATRLTLESVLVSPQAVETGASLVPGGTLQIAWEELARSRPVRFREGDRILVVLESLPGHSIWRKRFPDPAVRTRVVAVAERGEAFLRDPSLASVSILEHYLLLLAGERRAASGVNHLTHLLEVAEPPLAISALGVLGRVPSLDSSLQGVAAERTVRALLRGESAPGLMHPLLAWIGRERPEALRQPLDGQVTVDPDTGVPGPPVVVEAIGRLDGALPEDWTRALLVSGDPGLRRIAARFSPQLGDEDPLGRLARNDPSPEVRAAALRRLGERDGHRALGGLMAGLADAEPTVRAEAVMELGKLGSAVVPELNRLAREGQEGEAQAALAALSLAGEAGEVALGQIAVDHSDPDMRKLARMALGQLPGHDE